jgi:hypothetical protein
MNTELQEGFFKKESTKERKTGLASYYAAIAVDIILLYVLNNLRYMNVSIITPDFTSCLWAVNLSLSVGFFGNFILLIYRPRWFHHLVQAALSLLAILAIYVVYKIFPFDLDREAFRTAVRIFLIFIMAGAGIGFLVEFIRFIIASVRREQTPRPPITPPASAPPEPSGQPESFEVPVSSGSFQPDSSSSPPVPPEQPQQPESPITN